MAFHPLHSFRKHQKFWMASMILLAMVTFVLCSGAGDFQNWLSQWMSRNRGTEIARINGKAWYEKQLHDVRDERNIANDFMRKSLEVTRERWKERLNEAGKIKSDKERREQEGYLLAVLADLEDGLKRPRYFEGGTKLDDLIDFVLWQEQADRLGIYLTPKGVDVEVMRSIHARDRDFAAFSAWDARAVQNKVRETHYQATDEAVLAALNKEFRVRIAKLALMGVRPDMLTRGAIAANKEMEVRMPLSPDQMWDYYGKNIVGFQEALVPVKVADFMSQVPEPTEPQLQALFEARRKMKYDPESPTPGFEVPPRVKITWVTANPDGPFYRNLSHAVTTLEETPPVVWTPMLPALGEAVRYAAGKPMLDAVLAQNYESYKREQATLERYLLKHPPSVEFFGPPRSWSPVTETYFALPIYTQLYQPRPAVAAATVVAALAPLQVLAPAVYQADAYLTQEKELVPVLEKEAERRWPVGATLVLSASGPSPLAAATLAVGAGTEPQWLPFGAVRGELLEKFEARRAREWVARAMERVKKQLDIDRGSNPEGFKARLELLKKQPLGLEVHSTKKFVNQFEVGADPELQVFKESFEKYREQLNKIEGRLGTERVLGEDDFYKLFFDSTEPFSVSNAVAYSPQMWPPEVTVDVNRSRSAVLQTKQQAEAQPQSIKMWNLAAMPILFWKTDAEKGRVPATLDEVRERVREAWKMQEARKLALPAAERVAEALRPLQVTGGKYLPVMQDQAHKLHEQVLMLDQVAPLTLVSDNPPKYKEFQLPRGLIPHPRPEMAKDLLALNDLQQPLKTGVKEVDEVNKKLFDKNLLKKEPQPKQVQVLTNKDESVFYVAAVVEDHTPRVPMFTMAYQHAVGGGMNDMFPGMGRNQDPLVDLAQEQAAKDFRQRLVDQLRLDAQVEVLDRSKFDQESGS